MLAHILRRILSLFETEDRYVRFSMAVYLYKNRRVESYEARFRKHIDTGDIEVFTNKGTWISLNSVFKGTTLSRIMRRANIYAEKAQKEAGSV